MHDQHAGEATLLTVDDLAAYVRRNGLAAEIMRLETPTPTVLAAAMAVGSAPEQIGKSILFFIHDAPHLVIANGLYRLDYRRLAAYFGVGRRTIRLANAEQVAVITGYPVGAVPPFGHRQVVPTLIEARVLAQPIIYVGGGALDALVRLTTLELQRALAAPVVDLVASDNASG